MDSNDCTKDQLTSIGSSKDSTAWDIWSQGQLLNMKGNQNDIGTAETSIASMIQCLQSLKTSKTSIPTAVEDLRQEIATLHTTLDEKADEVLIARRRVENMREPNRNVSFYQGWFPIDRPLRHETIPILIGFSILFVIFTLGFILSAMGIQFGFDVTHFLQSPQFAILHQMTPLFWITVVLLVTVTTVAVNIIRAK